MTSTASAAPVDQKLRCDAARNRERVLAAAMELYREHGGAFTVEEVASRAGVGIGTVYRRFPTKNALLDELARPFFEQLLATAQAARAHPRPAERLEVFIRSMAEQHAATGVRSGRLWDTALARPLRDQYQRTVELILADARDGGRVRPDVDVYDVGVVIWTVGGLIDATGRAAEVIWRRHLDLVLDGLRPGGHTSPTTRPIQQSDWEALVVAAPALRLG
ncbi:TetR/AcrR family transcriptional regulator [Frankia sp. CNm7]|uniref:TetR/AcrR family transcriptional regulator n=1 Tax=Frankia nepalensis TaxID=1836974 RepID=A0A937RI09_9ACTN|nr:TetR/AcrR family transcriptional regulator [Frankia nepalensis]MBL7499365.1 TetR/AcrR family transcriptional regulator [Frankia nepalensis]MBL7514123.1 TetR/AcrR family transcriptional regulator [Frankia nepalensis]MBL7518992.1 TetR/AcrR family transcriptional regulator [Frankia nepalensis]MBL7626381.1 TetR/AcrR family transcriptional regulator [Frankia nepalensis]